ncbi:hypothetical protein PTQ19_07235 [Microbacterium esteraromaticum]|uniref:hypothetical protein n=1 Tax=Microbacterium esteraromaticum TaxID=57043 RepID=UPI002368EC98|nr:hypothetical protein [Microbacterium esteraromaticum]WDH80217.1 hypothetical protein PTQ19_07235 [Microbacterium esteraromaticum]
MLIGVIRPIETRTIDVEADTLEALDAAVRAATPAGWDRTGPREISRRDGVREIEAQDLDAMAALVPDGWQLLSVRRS